MHFSITTILSLFTLSVLLLGCGESVQNGSTSKKYYPSNSKKTGYFIDSGVSGLEYQGQYGSNGTTQNGGSFRYNYGEILKFSIGNIMLGKSIALSTLTPKDIVSFENQEINTSIYAPAVNNRVRLLMSLDSDKNPANGISIDQNTRDQAQGWTTPDFNLSESDFTTALNTATNNELTSIATKKAAEEHFAASLRCVYSGAYRGQWLLPDGQKSGFVGVMIQSDGKIIAMGDGQQINNNTNAVIYSVGTHNMDTGTYIFEGQTYYYNPDKQEIDFANTADINGTGKSRGFNSVLGTFIQDGQSGTYSASRVGEGNNVAYRYTGLGKKPNGGIVGLFTLDINRNGTVKGMIHDSRVDKQFDLNGSVDFTTDNNNVDINVVSQEGYTLDGNISFSNWDSNLTLRWKDPNGNVLGSVDGIGCQLQTHK